MRRSVALSCFALVLAFAGGLVFTGARAGAQTPARDQPAPQPAGRALELKDYFRVEAAGSPVISPDGKLVAFVRTYIVETQNRRQTEIWLAPSDGSKAAMRLTDPSLNGSNPRWSPDGKLLAFSARPTRSAGDADQKIAVWLLRIDQPGSAPFQIPGLAGMPIFSPNNQWIAFTKKTPPADRPPKRFASDTERHIEDRFTGRIVDWMDYRSDGRGYVPDPRDPIATPPEELYLLPRTGGMPKQLTSLAVNVQSAAWRPDSGALVFAADTHQRDEYTYERSDLFIVNLDGQLKRLTDDGFNHSSPSFSSDGRFIFFRRQQGLSQVIAAKQNHGGPVDVYSLPAEGGEMKNLTSGWDLLPGAPTSSADGSSIYFSGGVGGNSHLFRVPAEGGAVEQITKGERSLSAFSLSTAAGRIAYSATDASHPAEVFAARLDGGNEKKLSGFNDDVISEIQLIPSERLVYASKDGTQIEGWVLRPRGYDPGKSGYPLILCIHGGPHGAYGNGFNFEFQLLAARGYLVLYTNPRGSTGYGEKFLWATWGGWGGLDYQDVMAGVDYAVKRFNVDEKRLGVTGYSYGGFMTNWIITQTSRFAAAVAGAGVSNWISDYGTADIPRTKESEFYGPPWEAKSGALLSEHSPITHAGNVTTPTLFVHGESDMRVPIEQAEQMYTALKKRRVPATLIRYPASYHGGWTPWNTVHRLYQELKWWERHLGASDTGRTASSSD